MNKKMLSIIIVGILILIFVFLITSKEEVIKNAVISQEDSLNKENVIGYTDDYNEIFSQVKTSNNIISFLNNNNFKYVPLINDNEVNIGDFYKSRQGGDKDFAFFIAGALSINYIPFIFTYEDDLRAYYVVAFRDTDLPKYIYVDEGGVHMVHHGWSFKDLCKKEEERLGIKIKRYGTLSPLNNLVPVEWVDY